MPRHAPPFGRCLLRPLRLPLQYLVGDHHGTQIYRMCEVVGVITLGQPYTVLGKRTTVGLRIQFADSQRDVKIQKASEGVEERMRFWRSQEWP